MKTGDKVVFKAPFWNGPPQDRAHNIYTVLSGTDAFGAHRGAAKRISLMGADGKARHGVVADRLEPAPSQPAQQATQPRHKARPSWMDPSYREPW